MSLPLRGGLVNWCLRRLWLGRLLRRLLLRHVLVGLFRRMQREILLRLFCLPLRGLLLGLFFCGHLGLLCLFCCRDLLLGRLLLRRLLIVCLDDLLRLQKRCIRLRDFCGVLAHLLREENLELCVLERLLLVGRGILDLVHDFAELDGPLHLLHLLLIRSQRLVRQGPEAQHAFVAACLAESCQCLIEDHVLTSGGEVQLPPALELTRHVRVQGLLVVTTEGLVGERVQVPLGPVQVIFQIIDIFLSLEVVNKTWAIRPLQRLVVAPLPHPHCGRHWTGGLQLLVFRVLPHQ
mmetsp:Transcript_4209/g.9662  ORF Transcript_4209/g.9662 Transcript_4209/m.9662 type:complete len:292 (+) Transcript_4209:402-1277(+)